MDTTSTESSCVPPGFRFHPTDEELVGYYLRKKVASQKIDLDVIRDIDLYRIEPWDLQDKCRIGYEEQNEWYFFSHKDKKYPTGTRTNRATMAGFWKATGRDKAVYDRAKLIGMRKTLVFYKGRAPNGLKSDWIMHEYRLESDDNAPPQEEGWVVCRAFKKRATGQSKSSSMNNEAWDSSYYYDEPSGNVSTSSLIIDHHITRPQPPIFLPNEHNLVCKTEIEPNENALLFADQFILQQLPQLESPSVLPPTKRPNCPSSLVEDNNNIREAGGYNNNNNNDEKKKKKKKVTADWRDLDKFVASQLSHGDRYGLEDVGGSGCSDYSDLGLILLQQSGGEEGGPKLNELSTSDCDFGICIFNK